MNGRRQHRLRTVLRGGVAITTLGISGPRDSNAWLGKIVCDRPHKGIHANAFESTRCVAANLARARPSCRRGSSSPPLSAITAQTRHRSWKTLRHSGGDCTALLS
jgi:hypothetical protein